MLVLGGVMVVLIVLGIDCRVSGVFEFWLYVVVVFCIFLVFDVGRV